MSVLKSTNKTYIVTGGSSGIGYLQPLLELTEQDFENVFATNVKGLMFTSKTFMDLLTNDTGIICNISSIAGMVEDIFINNSVGDL
jgi:NAD(P)-dependent dehydrogenase (short-subunit alcohol dehydrogenase family)